MFKIFSLTAAALTAITVLTSDICAEHTDIKTVRVGYYDDYAEFQNGASDDERKSGYAYEFLQDTAKYAGWTYEYTYGKRSDIYRMLENGDVDIVAGTAKSENKNGNVLFPEHNMGYDNDAPDILPEISNEDIYIGVSKDRRDLLSELNDAQSKIFASDPYYCLKLQEKYYKNDTPSGISPEGIKWLNDHSTIMIGYLDDYMPYCDIDKSKDPSGAMTTIFKNMSYFIGKSISAVKYNTYDELCAALENNEIDAIFPAYRELWNAEKNDYIMTQKFADDSMVCVYSGEYGQTAALSSFKTPSDLCESLGKFDKIAVLSGSPVQEIYTSSAFPEAICVPYTDIQSCLNAVKKGYVNAFITENNVISCYFSSDNSYDDLLKANIDDTIEYCFALQKDDRVLCEILDAALSCIDRNTINIAITENSYIHRDYSFIEFVQHNFIRVMIIAICLAAIIFLVICKIKREKRKNEKKLEEAYEKEDQHKQEIADYKQQSEYDHLTGVFSRGHFMQQAETKIKHHRPNDILRLVMLDIDNFKSVNDTYGHDCGDIVLMKLGEILKDISRVNGFSGRYGGEEFIIFLFGEDTNIQAHIIGQVCRKLRDANFDFTKKSITMSMGVTDIKDGDTLEECIERADKALYYSKKNGKNQVNWYEETIDKKTKF